MLQEPPGTRQFRHVPCTCYSRRAQTDPTFAANLSHQPSKIKICLYILRHSEFNGEWRGSIFIIFRLSCCIAFLIEKSCFLLKSLFFYVVYIIFGNGCANLARRRTTTFFWHEIRAFRAWCPLMFIINTCRIINRT